MFRQRLTILFSLTDKDAQVTIDCEVHCLKRTNTLSQAGPIAKENPLAHSSIAHH